MIDEREEDEQELEEIEEIEEPEVEVEVEETPTEEDLEARRNLEDEARKFGWRPKSGFDRDPKGWLDADQFLDLPQTQVKKLRDEIAERDKRLENQDQRLNAVAEMQRKAMDRVREQEQRRHEDAIEQVRREMRQAAAEADPDAFDRAAQRERDLQKNYKPVDVEQTPRQPDPTIAQFRQENEWAQDPVLWQEAVRSLDAALEMGASIPSTTAGQIEFAANSMKQRYPHLFQPRQQQQQAPRSRVDGGGLGSGLQRRGPKGADDLPPEAKAAGKDLVEDGIYKNLTEYAKDYWENDS